MVTYILILVVSAYMLLRPSKWKVPGDGTHLFRQAILFSLLIIVFHGFFDDALYGNQGTPLIFLTAGLAVALSQPVGQYNKDDGHHFSILATNNYKKYFRYVGLLSLLILLAGTAIFYKNLMSVSLANLAAIQMGMVQLNDFPTGEWDDGSTPARLASAKVDFLKALEFNPLNRIANYRMGLIAMQEQDYRTAEIYLNIALARNQHHRGVIKNLGFSYVWLGEYDNALWYLAQIPEAKQELDAYTWWWESQGQRELALRAQRMKKRLDNPVSH